MIDPPSPLRDVDATDPARRGAGQPAHSETARQIVHMSMGGFALLLRWLTWWQAIALAAAAVAFNMFALPRTARRLFRPGDDARALHGIVLYPIAVLLMLVTFPRRPDITAAAWGILALGDGAATLAGRALGGPRWPWNRDKTLSGSATFAIAGGAGAVFLAWWCRDAAHPVPPLAFTIAAPLAAALVAAAVETIPVRLDDNLSVAISASAVLWIASVIDASHARDAWPIVLPRLPWALAVNVAVAWAGHRARTVSVSGAIAGAIIGTIIFAALGWPGWMLLLVTFLAAAVASRMGWQRKMLLGIAEERGGRRGAGNAIANTGVAALAAVLVLLAPDALAARVAVVAALTAGGSDTIASEIGKAWGRRTWSITSLRRVPPGTSGAMSVEGTAAGVAGAFALAAVGIGLGIAPPLALLPIVIGATLGALLESWLGATLEAPGILSNDMLNFINTAAAAALAVCFFRTFA
jgi:uncharacterized protein (TIGR00297 family)